jgi:hypothetical protein
VQDFLGKLAASKQLASLSEYGVGAATLAPAITLADAPPAQITNFDIQSWVAGAIASGQLPAPDANTLYTLVYPPQTEVDFVGFFGGGFPECSGFGAYHDAIVLPSGAVASFVVSARCANVLTFTGLDALTVPLSSELAGALTNPQPLIAPAYQGTDFRGSGWSSQTPTGEIGELCETLPGGLVKPADVGYTVTRVWSNKAAAATREPCAPAAGATRYFGAAPILDGTEPFAFTFVNGITVPPGGEATFPVVLFGEASRWKLSATEAWSAFGSPDPNNLLSVSFDRTTGGPGDIRWVTVKRAPQPAGAPPVPLSFAIQSTAGRETHSWVVAVGQ